MGTLNTAFVSTLVFVVIGYALKKGKIIPYAEGKVLSRLLMYTTFPALMIVSTREIEISRQLFLIPIFAIFISAVMLCIGFYIFKNEIKHIRGVLTMSCGGWNVGLFGFPLIESIWGPEALVFAIFYDIGNTFLAFGILYPIGNYFSETPTPGGLSTIKKILLLPPVLGMLIGLSINGADIEMPAILEGVLTTLAKANKPLVLILLGIYLNFHLNKSRLHGIINVFIIRYGIGILTILAIYMFLPHTIMSEVLMALVILPIGMSILLFSDELGYDSEISGTLTNLSLLISFGFLWALTTLLQSH
jgi:predicted permease